MGSSPLHIPDDLRSFLRTDWDSDVRLTWRSEDARSDMRLHGIEGVVRRYLADAILHGTVSPEVWSKMFNVQTFSAEEVREDATEFWQWLFDDAPLPSDSGASGTVQPPPV